MIETLYEQTAAKATALVPDISAVDQPISLNRDTVRSSRFFELPPVNRRFTIAASTAIVMALLAIGAVSGFLFIRTHYLANAAVERSLNTFRDAGRDMRTCEFRFTGLDYAPYRLRGNDTSAYKKRFSEANDLAAQTVVKYPTPAARHVLGSILTAEADYDRAVAELKTASKEAPDDAAILSDLAVALALKGETAAAIEALNRALEIEPGRIEALFNRALLNQRLKQYDAALADWKNYLAADPSSPWANEAQRNLSSLER
jgi:tetratricopeptide (TPR) repeat protein